MAYSSVWQEQTTPASFTKNPAHGVTCSGKEKGERRQSPSSESTPVAHCGHSDPENALLLGSQRHWPCNTVTTAGKGDTGVCQESMQGSERREQSRRVYKSGLRKERKGRHAVLHTAHAQPSQQDSTAIPTSGSVALTVERILTLPLWFAFSPLCCCPTEHVI